MATAKKAPAKKVAAKKVAAKPAAKKCCCKKVEAKKAPAKKAPAKMGAAKKACCTNANAKPTLSKCCKKAVEPKKKGTAAKLACTTQAGAKKAKKSVLPTDLLKRREVFNPAPFLFLIRNALAARRARSIRSPELDRHTALQPTLAGAARWAVERPSVAAPRLAG